MKKFKDFINEETMPFAQTDKGFVGVDSEAVRDNINSLLNGVTTSGFITPYIALEKIRKVLANFHIFLPKVVFNDGDSGIHTFEISQFGEKIGMTDDGKVVTKENDPYHLYFEWQMNDDGMFDVFSEVVDEEELEELVDDYNEEEDDEEELDEEIQINELKGSTARSAEHKAAEKYYTDYDDEAAARKEYMRKKTPEAKEKAEAAKAKREKSKDRVIRFQKYADKKESESKAKK